MKKYSLLFIALILIAGCAVPAASPGEKLFRSAQTLERKADYFKALDLYKKALPVLRREGKKALVREGLAASTRMQKIAMTYTFSEEAVRNLIKKAYPGTSDQRIDRVIKDGRLPQLLVGGKTYYFADFLNTLGHIYPDFRSRQAPGALGKSEKFFKIMSRYIYEKDAARPGRTLVNPIRYLAEGEAVLPRKKLPPKGLLKVWVPLPLVTAAQPEVEIVSIYPEDYIYYPIKTDGDIGLAYLEIPLEQVKGDLKIGARFKFTHFEERFKINPKKIGAYDRDSDLYKRYTRPEKNIAVTPAIRAMAQKLAGTETNPYKIAKRFYDHIVWDLDYSYMPHAALEALNIPEAVYVHEHGYGDCGAQSMYFAALCRAAGIPARAPGGMQLFPLGPAGCGDHFWAQIYLPNYGWVPVDTSVGQLGKYMPGLTKKQQREFADYFFANMEPFRYLIQQDVDVPFIPAADGELAFAMVLQAPTALCNEMDENPGIMLMDYWRIKVKPIALRR